MELDINIDIGGGFSDGLVVKNLPACRGCGFDLWVGKIPGEGNGNPLQYSCLGNPMDRGAWGAAVHEVAKRVGHNFQLNNNIDIDTDTEHFCHHKKFYWKCLCRE